MEEDDKSKIEKFDKGKRGGAEPEINEAEKKRRFLWNLHCFTEDEPREDILERVGATKEEWSKTNRIPRDDEPHDDDMK
eukprot:CAMPEP_0185749956 /NCGR_PEP_ID=MMETSP1174-20130828/8667_1 /TAXON_ID=35687 /ORGANISM="Dictyocha speculum, Strain CCMP1381" /LENGTH=78 /DNA_ID=CAMNT_0028426281 /DNA_START=218 /DNA_END=451 /DNA_ORIENTATION=+